MNQVKSVFIQVDHKVLGSAKCSALQFDDVIIAHGRLLYFLSSSNDSIGDENAILSNFKWVINELMQQQYFTTLGKNQGNVTFNFKVLRENVSHFNFTKSDVDNSGNIERKIPSGNPYTFEDARLCLVYKYKEENFANDIFNLGFTKGENIDYNSYERLVIPVFLFLMTGRPTKYSFQKSSHTLLTVMKGTQIHPGLSIAVESTPFANLSFYNSLARGIISKTLGSEQDGLLIDARVVFGCEGAPIHVFENGSKGTVIGIVVCVVSRREEEWIGFSLGLSLEHLLSAVLGLNIYDYIPFNKLKLPIPSSSLDIGQLSSSVLLVRCQYKRGSGVVVDADSGLVLTCAHNIHHALDSVQVIFKGKAHSARVEYASSPSDLYDLALLSVGKIPGLKTLKIAETSPVVGESVVTIGFGLSTESSIVAGGTPTLSNGCISKVSPKGGPLQTTCCSQSGVSGGAVLRPPDQLIGIVVSNIRLQHASSILPFFSFAVSVDDFRSAISQFIQTKDPTCLRSLTVKNPEVKLKWMLHDSKL